MTIRVQLESACYQYRRGPMIGPVTLEVPAGRTLGLVGPNGSGKTTLLKMILGLINISSGSVRVAGQRVVAGRLPPMVSGIVESPAFISTLTGRDTLLLAASGQPERLARLDSLLVESGLEAAADQKVSNYSLGMKQRLAIARALLGDPRVLLLDEPTNGLDPPGIRWFRELLIHRARSGCADIVSSHLLYETELFASDYLIINEGSVMATGSLDDVRAASGSLEAVYFDFLGRSHAGK